MSEPTNNELHIELQNLTSKVIEGFKGIHDRQDCTNGNVMKNTEWRLKSEGSLNTIKWILSFVGIGNIVLLIKVLFL